MSSPERTGAAASPNPAEGWGGCSIMPLKSDKTLAELAQQYDIHPNQITDWKRQLTERAVQVFGDASSPASSDPDLTKLHAKIGQLALENDFLEHALTKAGLLSAKR